MGSVTYTFNIGDRVKYTKIYYHHVVCDKCGHEEVESTSRRRIGRIAERKYDYDYGFKVLDFTVTDAVSVLPNGMIEHKPYMSAPSVINPKPFYKIGGSWYSEDDLEVVKGGKG